MASFDEAPPGDVKSGEKIFKMKCAQCHTAEKGAGHKQVLCNCCRALWMYVYSVSYESIMRVNIRPDSACCLVDTLVETAQRQFTARWRVAIITKNVV
ncbi:uncharacterized protein LOC114173682 isoform X2 [Vigna unguiculata]|uniref:Cytochrome c n=1 Tax=Vigna unguiculata TaxID=3917 RepID=A0A4D6LQD4_VIGUN|nr:uncharacterized protein LOC114173682 isoform X2 [Vigna unguiculata]QCD90336.1 cytochrome c [Vigna unguiculata]